MMFGGSIGVCDVSVGGEDGLGDVSERGKVSVVGIELGREFCDGQEYGKIGVDCFGFVVVSVGGTSKRGGMNEVVMEWGSYMFIEPNIFLEMMN